MADKRIIDFVVLEDAQDEDLLLIASNKTTYAIKVKTIKDAVEGMAQRAEAAALETKGMIENALSVADIAEAKAQLAQEAASAANIATEAAKAITSTVITLTEESNAAKDAANTAAQTAREKAQAAHEAATVATAATQEAKTAINETIVATGEANAARNAANTAAQAAQEKAQLAQSAAASATAATRESQSATDAAKAATTEANSSRDAANTAAQNAQEKAHAAEEATNAANAATTGANNAATAANTAATSAGTAAQNAQVQADYAKGQGDRANDLLGKIEDTDIGGMAADIIDLQNSKASRAELTAGLGGKADLVGGKVPAGQLPEMDYDPAGSAAGVQGSLNAHAGNKSNPHGVTAAQVGVTAKRTCRFVVGTCTAGWTANDCDYLCDGVDDQEEINAAIQALPATGGNVIVLGGIYHISAPIFITKNAVAISGAGNSTELVRQWNSDSTGVIYEGLFHVSCDFCYVMSLKIGMDPNEYPFYGNSGIYVENGSNSAFCHLHIAGVKVGVYICENSVNCNVSQNTMTQVYQGVYNYGSKSAIVSNTIRASTDGVLSRGNDAIICKNDCANGQRGIYIAKGTCCIVSENLSTDASIDGILCDGSFNQISGNICLDYSRSGIYCTKANNNNIIGNVFIRGSGTSGDYSTSQYTIYLKGTNNKNNLIANNNIMGKNYTSDGGTGNTFTNNKYN